MKRCTKHLDLIQEITNLLKDADHPNPQKWVNALNTYTPREGLCLNKIQRIIINQYWSIQLNSIQDSTLYERLVLRMKICDIEFLSAFKISVLPTIIKYNLGV